MRISSIYEMDRQTLDILEEQQSQYNLLSNLPTTFNPFFNSSTRANPSPIINMSTPVALILGAGPKVGLPAAKAFASIGYKVAIAARSLSESDSTETQLNIKADFARPEEVINAFAKVRKELGVPSVVLYNGKPSCIFY
jgi:hypothetical protein